MLRVLDAYCGGGGAAAGYLQAGFEVYGVDVVDHSAYYPGVFHQGDAIEYIKNYGHLFDLIHASPPCPRYSSITPVGARDGHPDLVDDTRLALEGTGTPWVMENVPGSPVRPDLVLCGSMFDLQSSGWLLRRHRNFEFSGDVPSQPKCSCAEWRGRVAGVYGCLSNDGFRTYNTKRSGVKFPYEHAKIVMGVDLPKKPLSQAIPAAYTRYIGDSFKKSAWR